jgi:nitroreductase
MVIDPIKKRRSIREYKPDAVSGEDIEEIIKAAQFAPTAHGSKATEFIVIRDQGLKEKIFAVVGQNYVKDTPVLIAPVISTEKSKLPVQDLSVASAYMFLEAADRGLGTVWKNLSPEWEEKVKVLLGVPEKFRIINLIPVGYPIAQLPGHNDEEFATGKIHNERW